MREELMKRLKENDDFEDASVDEILRILIEQTNLSEVTCCLDMIASEEGTRVASFNWTGMTYPCGPKADLVIPPPSWKLDEKGIKKIINEDNQVEVLVQADQNEKGMEQTGALDLPENLENDDLKTEGGPDGNPTGE